MKAGRFRLVAAALLTLLAVAGAYAFTAIQPKPREKPLAAEVPLTNIVTLKVYRSDGRVETYQKVGDPWTQNLMAALANFLFGRYNTNPLTLYARDGTAKTQVETEYTTPAGTNLHNIDPYLAIGIGSGTASPTFYDVDLSNLIALIDVAASGVSVTDNGTHIIASYTVSYTASSAVTVSEVGLYWKAADYNTNTYRYYLFARDVLSSPISLAANDVLAVTYTVAFKYNQPPMTYNFAALMFNYLFGLNYYGKALTFTTTDGTATGNADFGTDTGSSGDDAVKEYAKVRFGSGTPSYIAKINGREERARHHEQRAGERGQQLDALLLHPDGRLPVHQRRHGQRGRPDHRQHRHRRRPAPQREAAPGALLPDNQPRERARGRGRQVHVHDRVQDLAVRCSK